MKKRMLSIILSMTMVAAQMSMITFAIEETDQSKAQNSEIVSETLKGAEQQGAGGLGDPRPAPIVRDGQGEFKMRLSGIPTYYDSKRYLTSIKDQDALEICWSYATIAAVEASLLAQKKVSSAKNLDLSERQLAYFSFNLQPDMLGNTADDKNVPIREIPFNNYIQNWGSAWLTTLVMASGIGVTNESVAPVDDLIKKWWSYGYGEWYSDEFHNATKLSSALARGSNEWSLSNAKRINMQQKNQVKQAIMKYGGVAAAMNLNINSSERDQKNVSWNSKKACYYNKKLNSSNHLITIVGWNDGYNKSNFKDDFFNSILPENNGAWLCRNSYGKGWGQDGYFWVSYDDCYFNQDYASAYAFEMRQASINEIMYQYDGASGDYYNLIDSGGSIANIYTVAAADGVDEILKSVCISLLNEGEVDYEIQVYTNCTNAKDPTSGIPAFSTPQKGKTDHAGFYTIPLKQEVSLKSGSKFAVVFTLRHSSGEVKYDVDASGSYGGTRYVSAVKQNQSFEKDNSSARWEDLSANNHDDKDEPKCAARIKAITEARKKSTSVGKTTIRNTIANTVANPKYMDVIYDAVPGATSYDMAYKNRNSKNWVIRDKGKTTRAKANGLTVKSLYEIKIRARKAETVTHKAAVGNWSPTIYRYFFTVQKIRLKSASKGSFTMSWNKDPGATGYQVMFSTKSNGAGAAKNINTVGKNATSFTKKGLKSGKTYYVQVRALKKVGNTTYIGNISKPVAVKVK